MPDASTRAAQPSPPPGQAPRLHHDGGPAEPATVPSAAPASVNLDLPHGQVSAATPRSRPGARPQPPPPRPQAARRRSLRWLRVVALVIGLPVLALCIGLLIAWIAHQVRGNQAVNSGSTAPQPSASAAASAKPTPAPHRVTVPADWVAESQPPAGLTFRHPPGWVRRTELPEILRFAPVSAGSLTPGIEGVGAGLEPTADPSQALREFVARAYAGQPQLQEGPITAVSGAHPGEQQEIVTYTRAGVPVRVVVHAFASSGQTVIALGRAASSVPARAAELEAAVEASVQLTG